jgi:hypothetical protein
LVFDEGTESADIATNENILLLDTSDTLSKTSFNIKMSHFTGMKKVNTFEYTSLLFEKGWGK